MRLQVRCCLTSAGWVAGCGCLLFVVGLDCQAQPLTEPAAGAEAFPAVLTREDAVRWALQYNPELATFRQQRGITAAAVIIAETYPFNPIWEARVQGNSGPASAGITSSVANEHRVTLEVELRHQGRYRRQAGYAALSRTEWEVAFQEQLLAIRTIRAFNAVLYRQRKFQLLDETVTLSEQTLRQATASFNASKVTRADLILAEADVYDARAQLGLGRTAVVSALYDLRRALGIVDYKLIVQGALELPRADWNANALLAGAFEQRADLRARQAAVSEAEARLDLENANRYGNPSIGPVYTYDPTQVSSSGLSLTVPLPVLNTHRGEIEQRRAERERAALDLGQVQVAIAQDVDAALRRLHAARAWQQTYEKEVLPRLEGNLKEMQDLFSRALVDVLRVSAVRRSLIRARDAYLDALFEVSQAQADLAAAAGDATLAIGPGAVHQ